MTSKQILNIIALLCLGSVAFALFSQHYLDMQPCAWCVFQRFIFLSIAVICLIANFVPAGVWTRLFAFFSFSLSISGVLSAWYQFSVAANTFSCDMTFADLFIAKWTKLDALLPYVFGIYATCMEAKVDLLGIDYALWALALFAFLAVVSLVALFKRQEREWFL